MGFILLGGRSVLGYDIFEAIAERQEPTDPPQSRVSGTNSGTPNTRVSTTAVSDISLFSSLRQCRVPKGERNCFSGMLRDHRSPSSRAEVVLLSFHDDVFQVRVSPRAFRVSKLEENFLKYFSFLTGQ